MRNFLRHIIVSALLGAVIGAVAGFVTSDFMREGAVGGAVIGALVGAYFGMRIEAYRVARRYPEKALRLAHEREGRRQTLNKFAPGSNMGDSIKVGSIHGKMDRYADGSTPYR